MLALRSQTILALDACAVRGVRVRRTLLGLRAGPQAEQPLAPGALVPSAFAANVVEPSAVAQALGRVASVLGVAGAVTLVLPDGVARTSLIELPRGTAASDFVRFRLTPSLPFAPDAAIFGHAPIDRRHVLGAAVRRDIVAGYESAARAAGLEPAAVVLAPLAAAPSLLKAAAGVDLAVCILAGDAALSLFVLRRGELLSFRTRRRAPGGDEVQRLEDDVMRSVAACGFSGRPKVLLAGAGAEALVTPSGWFQLAPSFSAPALWALA